jgi:succinylarginine dihydrolase
MNQIRYNYLNYIIFFTQAKLVLFIHNNSFNTRRTIIKDLGTNVKTSCLSKIMSYSISLPSNMTDLTV